MGLSLFFLASLLAWLSTRYVIESDWTRNKKHTLSEASEQIIAMLDQRIEITAYARKQEAMRQAIKRFIGRYQHSNADIVLHFINPDAVPDETREMGISENGELIIYYQGRSERVWPINEETFTNALQRLLRNSERWLAFVEGHGERNPLGKANHDLGELGRQLANRGFKLHSLNLMQIKVIPDNTSVLVIAGPLVDYLPGEVEIILNYLQKGGNLLWLAEPNNIYGLEALAAYMDIQFQKGTVIDLSGQLTGINEPTVVLINKDLYEPHPALNGFVFPSLFPRSGAITAKQSATWTIKSLVKSSDLSWLESGPLKGEVNFQEDEDIHGPLALAASLERTISSEQDGEKTEALQRIVVSADGDFLSNNYIGNSGNFELGLRLINWLSLDDDFISIHEFVARDTYLNSQLIIGIIGFFLLFISPLLFLATGTWIWWKRKKL